MENFQLYRTNLLLGGQMKWDLILDSGNAALHVSDFHLTPISPNIPYTYCSDENLLNNTHQDNIKAYYKKLQGYFYNDGLDTQFNHNYPMIVTNGETPTFYSGIYDMGCKRTKHFKLYGKQIEFFCPVWLEKLDGVLSFKVSVYSFGSDIPMGTRTLTFDLGKHDTHNKFVNYFKNFITYTQIDKGNDKLLNISFNQNKAFVSGINVKTGTYVTKDISTIVPNLVSRERPLMEFDNMLIGNFTNNNIICNNLFNFNLCFNLEDLTSTTLAQLLLGKDLTISVDVQIDDVSIDKKSFYTEYDFIERTVFDGYSVINNIDTPNIEEILPEIPETPVIIEKECPKCGHGFFTVLPDNPGIKPADPTTPTIKRCSSCGAVLNTSTTMCPVCGAFNIGADLDDNVQENIQHAYVKEKFNVLEHLKDNKYLEFVNKNKFNQSVCHWSLTGYNDYIFNLYRGFDGLFIDLNTGLTYENEHQYGATPDLNSIKFNPQYNSCGWFNTSEKEIWSEIYLYTIDENLIPKDGTKFDNSIYINNVKYNNTYKGEPFYVYGIVTSSRNVGVFATSVNSKKLNSKNSVYVNEKNNNILFVTDIADEFTFLNLFETLRNTEELSGNLLKFYDIMRSKISPSLIRFGGLLNWDIADGPTYDIDEIEYYKNDKEQDYVFRYDGSIKPTFISESKYTIYYKDFVSDDRSNGKSNLQNSIYPQYINTGFEPLYPSINYCSIRKCADWKYNALPIVSVTENNEQPLFKYDYSWFNHGKYLHLQYKIKFEHINRPNDYGRYDTLDEIVYEYLKDMYGTDYNTTKYIQSKYTVKNNWEYFSDRNVTDYVYKIELTLK